MVTADADVVEIQALAIGLEIVVIGTDLTMVEEPERGRRFFLTMRAATRMPMTTAAPTPTMAPTVLPFDDTVRAATALPSSPVMTPGLLGLGGGEGG